MTVRISNTIVSYLLSIIVALCTLVPCGCDQGLAPEPAAPSTHVYGIRGVITFKNWPPADSVRDLRLAVLQNYPVENLVNEVLLGRARFTDRLPYGLDSIAYTLTLTPLPPGRFPLVGVAQQYGPNQLSDWRVVGVFFANGDTTRPGAIDVPPDSIVSGIDVHVDFQHLPPQP